MTKLRVGVLRGGPSAEYEVSLKTGGAVLKHLPADKYLLRDILITRDGTWHLNGVPARPEQVTGSVDLIFNALHGEYGEDGTVQELLDNLRLPYTGSGRLAAALAMNKPLASAHFKAAGGRVPVSLLVEGEEDPEAAAGRIFLKLSPPWVVKPADRGSSVGLSFVKKFTDLAAAIKQAATVSKKILVEQFIKGREATVGVIDHFRSQPIYVLPPIEIRAPGNKPVWDYNDKYSGETQEICPGLFSEGEKEELARLAALAHETLNLRHYSRSDFIVTPRGIYLLEVNTLPGLTPESLMPKALAAVGVDYPQFLDHIIDLALTK